MRNPMNSQNNKDQNDDWWQKPGFSIQYQIEVRPGWLWNRNYVKFNSSMMDEKGNLKFDGPFCKMEKWVQFSKRVGAEYHAFETKWCDGICYWDTQFTNWKTPTDYCKIYAEESRKAKIPFLFYYCSIFDHNPQFDDIQPVREITPSYIAMHHDDKKAIAEFSKNYLKLVWEANQKEFAERKVPPYKEEFYQEVEYHDFIYNPEKYEEYLTNQIRELIEKYEPDGMWMDWYWNDRSTTLIQEFMEKNFPNTTLAFNVSIDKRPKYAHFLSGEAHYVEFAWINCQRYRNKRKPWELCGPVAHAWDIPIARPDPHEIFRIASIIMASGGKCCFGLPSQMNGELFPELARNVEMFATWYKERRELFREATPMKYKGDSVPGVSLKETQFGTIGSKFKDDFLIHIISFGGLMKDLMITFFKDHWENINKVILEPHEKELKFQDKDNEIILQLKKEDLDLADTILRIKCESMN